MSVDTFFDILTLLTTIFGLMACLFCFTERPRTAWLYLSGYYLASLLSDYFWLIYTFVMHDDPVSSGFMTNFGWNLSYLIMLICLIRLLKNEMRFFFHPLMLLPIPINIYQFTLYLPYGGLFNNIWSTLMCTGTACLAIQGILYYRKNRDNDAVFPYPHIFGLLLVISEYGMWTSSCFEFSGPLTDPYYYFEFIKCATSLLIPWGLKKYFSADESEKYEKNSTELRFQVTLQIIFSVIVLGSCMGGYALAMWMRGKLTGSGLLTGNSDVYEIIAIILFIISLFMSLLVMLVMFLTAQRQRQSAKTETVSLEGKKSRLNFIFILIITLGLMIFAIVYTANILYKVSVAGAYELGEDRVLSSGAELENYLNTSKSVLWVTADTIDDMVKNGITNDIIGGYLVTQTSNQKRQFDENFTGLYAYINGEYLDGLEWIPPEGYDPTSRVWYQYAMNASGDVAIVPPYVDAQTNSVIVTFCKRLSDGKNVVALDVIINHIQDLTKQININDRGYGLVIDDSGLIVAHHEPEYVGSTCDEVYGEDFLSAIQNAENDNISVMLDDTEHTVFVKKVLDLWYMLIVISDNDLLDDVRSQVSVSLLVFLIIFFLMTLFYYLGFKNEQAYGKKMQELMVDQQKQEYETSLLKLEKIAADEANSAKSKFLADMSHEIRTPINAVLGMNEMILRESSDLNILEYAENIKNSGNNLLQLINSILDFSKIEDGKMEITPVNYSTASMITYLVNSISERARSKGLTLNTDIDPGLPSELFGDDMRISQVTMNLLTNAVKYTPEGSVTLTIRDDGRQGDQVTLYVEVRDTGIGIKDEDMQRLFESFERLDVIRNRNIEGTGLGMSIVTKLLGLMGSELHVESKYGEGSSFSFRLTQTIKDPSPLGDYSERVSDYAKGLGHASHNQVFRASRAKILIVDDTKMNLIVATNLLKETEISIDTASSGYTALTLTKENRYDIILMDQRMPGIDGTQTLKLLREQEDGLNRETPVICLTADAITGARDRYLADGFTDYLTKPIDSFSLERKLLQYLPEDKVDIYKGPEDAPAAGVAHSPEPEAGADFPALRSLGLGIDDAMVYYQGDKDIYREVISEYASESDEKISNMNTYFEAKDWKNYGILAHSLKSTSKGIGARALSEIAAGLEKASNEEDAEFISGNHALAMEMFKKVADGIREELRDAAGNGDDDDDELFEFIP